VSGENGETVRRIAREADADRSLAALFAPSGCRADLFALYAFNAELARVAEQVSEAPLGAIRLQWWREAIERAASGEATGHPVADAVGDMIGRRGASRERVSRERIAALIDARAFDVETKIMPDGAAFDAYVRDTAGAVFALAAEIVGAKGANVGPATTAAGTAYGLTGLMRALPVHAARGLVFLPAEELRRHGTSPEQMLAGNTSEGLDDLLAELRAKAREALRDAEALIDGLDAAARRAFVPLSLVDPYLAALEKSGRDPLREIADINPLYRLWRMARWR
jgi:15-cis-phytoene synthase